MGVTLLLLLTQLANAALSGSSISGLFAFAFKKEQKRAYLIFRTHTGSEVIFDVPGKSTWELQAELSPVLKWLGGFIAADHPSE